MPDNTLQTLDNLMSLTSVRQKVISRNIANLNTEHYQREEVSFDEFFNAGLNNSMKATEEKHLGGSTTNKFSDMHVKVVKDETADYNSGVNNVNIDKEMSDLAENQILFKFAAKKINSYFHNLQDVIKGGSR